MHNAMVTILVVISVDSIVTKVTHAVTQSTNTLYFTLCTRLEYAQNLLKSTFFTVFYWQIADYTGYPQINEIAEL